MRAWLGLTLVVLATPVWGATWTRILGGAAATATDADGRVIAEDDAYALLGDTMTEGRSASGKADLRPKGFQFLGEGAGDIRTGAFSAVAEKGAGFGEVGSAGTFAQTFRARGSGLVTFRMDLNGYWETDFFNTGSCCPFEMFADVQVQGSGEFLDGSDFLVTPVDPDFKPSGKVPQSLSFATIVANGSKYDLFGGVSLQFIEDRFTGPVTGSAALDGIFSYAASDGVRLEFVDPEFMIAPVPLPAGWMLLVGAIGAAWTLRGPLRRLPRAA